MAARPPVMKRIETTLKQSLPEAEAAVRRALMAEGFGILTEIDVAATLEAKLGVRRTPLKILGACNPAIAHRALELDPSLVLVLPCNVALEEVGGGSTFVAVADPRSMLGGRDRSTAELLTLGEDAARILQRAIEQLAG